MDRMLAAVAVAVLAALATAAPVVLDGRTAAHRYDGHGALSAGASSRLLIDYPEPQRSEILDFLFKPKFGAALPIFKFEIGGDCQSTDGTEPSYMHTPEDVNCTRGYEIWLLQEALKRNPSILTYALSWGVPAWIGNGSFFSVDNLRYQVGYLQCIREATGVSVDYIGSWNERAYGGDDYITSLRRHLDAAGFNATKVVIPDGGNPEAIVTAAEANATFAASFDIVGLHYPCDHPCPAVQESLGKGYWSSEDYSTVADWAGAGCWGRLLNQNYVRMNMTSTISWSLIWSVYPNLPYFGNGLMYAMEPWSGNYTVNGPIWTSAHTTQFAAPGWWYLGTAGGGSGYLPGGGTYVTLIGPNKDASRFALVLETLEGDCLRCKGAQTSAQTVTFQLSGGMPGPGSTLHVWQTTESAQFVQLQDITVAADGSITVSVPRDGMLTVSTEGGASHGSFPSPPSPSAPFPLPYADNFNGYSYDELPRYWSDQGGSFAVRNGSMVQVVPVDPGSNAWVADPDPISLIGDGTGASWVNYTLAVTARFSGSADSAAVHGPAAWRAAGDGTTPAAVVPCDATSTAQRWTYGAPAAGYLSANAASGAAQQPSLSLTERKRRLSSAALSTDGGADVAPLTKLGAAASPPHGSSALCLNLDGCGKSLIYYQCVTSGGTCCGAECYEGLQWTLPAPGAAGGPLTSPLFGGTQCATAGSDGTLTMAPCSSAAANQSWTYNSSSTQLQLSGTGGAALCLSLPPPPPPYVQLCARIATYSGFGQKHGTSPGMCLVVFATGEWQARAGGVTLTSGTLPSSFAPSSPHTLSVTVVGDSFQGGVDGTRLFAAAHVPNAGSGGALGVGMAAIGSGYHWAAFDDFAATPAA